MILYYSIFAMLSALSLTEHKLNTQVKFFLLIIIVLVLVFFAGLRGEDAFADYWNYVFVFERVPDISEWLVGSYRYSFAKTWMEPAYVAYGAIVKVFTNDYIWMFTAVAFFSVGVASYQYYRYASLVFLTLLLFFVHTYFYRDMTQIRAACAAAVGLFLIFQIHNRNYIRSLLIVCVAGLFHMAALSYFLVIIASFFKLNRKRIIIVLLSSVILGGSGFSYWLINNIPAMGYITHKLTNYASSHYAEEISLFDITNVKNFSVVIFCLVFWNRLRDKVYLFDTLMVFLVVATCWRILMGDFGILAARVATFFSITEVILVAGIPLIFKQKTLAIFVVVFYAFITLQLNIHTKLEPYYFARGIFN